jgi:Tfp pilus assembly protein PilO
MEKHPRTFSPTLLMTTIALAILVGGYYLIIRPIQQKRDDLQRENVDSDIAIAALVQSMPLSGSDSTRIDAVRQAMASFELKLPQAGEMDKVLENVWRLAQANSLQTKTIKAPAVQNLAGYRQQQMDLSVCGDFGGFYQFLLQLEDSKRVLRITKMHLTRLDDHPGQVQAEMTIGVFFEPQKGEGDKL